MLSNKDQNISSMHRRFRCRNNFLLNQVKSDSPRNSDTRYQPQNEVSTLLKGPKYMSEVPQMSKQFVGINQAQRYSRKHQYSRTKFNQENNDPLLCTLLMTMNTIASSAKVSQITQLPPTPPQKQQTIEPRIEAYETETCLIRSIVSIRVMNPSKPTSFRNKIQITREEMSKYFHCPQRLAAQKLGVSLSTLKRRFYQLDIGRWPYQLTQDNRKRSVWHMINETESKCEKELSPLTVQTLTRLFSMSLQEQQRFATTQLSQSQRNQSLNGNESPSFIKFLHYVPRDETSPQPQSQSSSIPSSPSSNSVTNTKGIRKRPRRFLQLDDDETHTTVQKNGETNRKRQKLSISHDSHIRFKTKEIFSPSSPISPEEDSEQR